MGFLNKILIFFLSILLSLSLLFRLLFALPFRLFRSFIILTRHWWDSNLGQISSENKFLRPDGTLVVTFNVIISLKLNGCLDLEEFKKCVVDKCIVGNEFPQLKQQIVIHFGYPFWRTCPEFDIGDHITLTILDGTVEVNEFIKSLMNEPFDTKISPWKIQLVNDWNQNESYILCKFHHTLGDGVSLYNLAMRVADIPVPLQSPPNQPRFNLWNALSTNPLFFPIKLVRDFTYASKHPIFVPKSQERHFVKSEWISKDILKEIGRKYEVGFTTVLLCAITSAIRDHLIAIGQIIPQFLICVVPIRRPRRKTSELGNEITYVYFKLPTGKENLVERMKECKKTLEEAANSKFAMMLGFEAFIRNSYPLPLASSKSLAHLVLSSFPGPSAPISLFNGRNEIMDMSFYVNGTNHFGLNLSTLTYNGNLSIVFSADSSIFESEENATTFMDSLRHHIHDMNGLD